MVYRPFLLACAAKTPKVTVLSLNGLQRLLSIDAVSADILSSVIGTLRIQAESDDETVQVKILQTLLLALGSPSALARVEEGALSQALGLCFRLHGGAGRSPMITNTATATLRQVVALLFDRVSVTDEMAAFGVGSGSQSALAAASPIPVPVAVVGGRRGSSSCSGSAPAAPMRRLVQRISATAVQQRQQQLMTQAAEPHSPAFELQSQLALLSRTARCCWLLLHDLCLLSTGEHSLHDSLWLKLSAQLPVPVALELLEAVLAQNVVLISSVPPFAHLLRVQVCPLVIKLMSDRSHHGASLPFPLLLRLLRLMVLLVRHFHYLLAPDCEVCPVHPVSR